MKSIKVMIKNVHTFVIYHCSPVPLFEIAAIAPVKME